MDIIYFGFLLLFYFNDNVLANTTTPAPSTSPPPLCPDIMCTLEFIPEECREISLITIDGVTCSSCPKWKQGCKDGLTTPVTVTTNRPVVCPDLVCPKPAAPTECLTVETYDYNGIKCPKCPVQRAGCPTDTISQRTNIKRPRIACPLLKCEPTNIPEECKEIVQYDFMGRNCSSCPTWRDGCGPSQPAAQKLADAVRPVAELACPLYKCDADIPVECSVNQQYLTPNGRVCIRCPLWKRGCREQERIATNNGLLVPMDPAGQLNQRPDIPCPYFRCLSNTIPDKCKEEQPFEFNGKTCFRCPVWRTGCQGSTVLDRAETRTPQIACPLMKCDLPDLPRSCFQDEMFLFQGRMCHKCPRLKDECQTVVPPRPIAEIDPMKQAPAGERLNEIACPLQRCPMVYIPEECREFASFEFRGKMCTGCPRFKPGCRPLGTIPQGPMPTEIPQIPNIPQSPTRPAAVCPELGCPFIYIPQECREQPTYNYQGTTCNHCVRWREGCVPGSPSNNQQPEAPACPIFQCKQVQIPKECVEVPTVYIRGRNCTTCPRYKDGCIPNGQMVDQNSQGSLPTEIPMTPSGPGQQGELACPLIPCTLMLIPSECREERPYQFRGKTCYNCPVWREGCVPTPPKTPSGPGQEDVACPLVPCNRMFIPSECREERPYKFRGKTCFNCPVWREGCVPTTPMPPSGPGQQGELACPLIPCTLMLIPSECREERPYQFRGKTCYNCPVWREGCVPTPMSPSGPEQQGEVACPLVPCNKMLIPSECREERPYQFRGKTCYNCPEWREGCVPTPMSPSGPGQQGEVACPLVPCNRMFIPSECREERPYQFLGKTCYNCPVWRQGCVPGNQQLNTDKNTNKEAPVVTTKEDIPASNIACPLVRCNKMYIPSECREETPYVFMGGKTCFRCPKWREGCVPGQGKQQIANIDINNPNMDTRKSPTNTNTDIVNKDTSGSDRNANTDVTNIPNTGSSSRLSNLRGVIPVDELLQMVNQIECPPLPCPAVYIPPRCMETVPYVYRGRLCSGCPTWRFGCSALNGQWQNSNFDGLLAYNLFRELAGFSA